MFSVVQDKNYQEMIQYIVNSHLFTDYVIVPVEDKRGTDVSEIEDTFYKYIDRDLHSVTVFSSILEGKQYIMERKQKNDMVFIVGSLYLVGMAKKTFGGC